MLFGTMLYSTDYAMRPDEFAVACEDRGFESVWYPEHTHIPASRRTPFPGGGELPQDYWQSILGSMRAAFQLKYVRTHWERRPTVF